jgi:1,4-alpha-glucan branching enzyme
MTTATATQPAKTRVTFEVPADAAAESACVCGDFNDWSVDADPMQRRKDGSHTITLQLAPGRHGYRYVLDGQRWENDCAAADYVPNEFGSENSVIEV